MGEKWGIPKSLFRVENNCWQMCPSEQPQRAALLVVGVALIPAVFFDFQQIAALHHSPPIFEQELKHFCEGSCEDWLKFEYFVDKLPYEMVGIILKALSLGASHVAWLI